MTTEEIRFVFGRLAWLAHLSIAASFVGFFWLWIIEANLEHQILGVPGYERRSLDRPSAIEMKGSTYFVSEADQQKYNFSRQAIPFTFLPTVIVVTLGHRQLRAKQKSFEI